MGFSRSKPSTASSSTPDRWLLTPSVPPAVRLPATCATADHGAAMSTRCIGPIHRKDTWPAAAAQAHRGRPVPRTGLPPGWDSASGPFRRNLSGMRRSVVDYGLARRATLASVFAGRTTVTDVCDAHPYLLRAAKFHGEPTDRACPSCRKAKLTHVTYVYGDELGRYEGRV